MELTEDQIDAMYNVFSLIKEYQDNNKDNNTAIADAKSNFIEKILPTPEGKLDPKSKEFRKNEIKELKSLMADLYKSYTRQNNEEVDTMEDAVRISSRFLANKKDRYING